LFVSILWEGEIAGCQEKDHERLVDIWYRAVVRTHTFLTEEDIQFYKNIVQNEAMKELEVWVAVNELQEPTGFIGLNGPKFEMLFVAPDQHGKGIGTRPFFPAFRFFVSNTYQTLLFYSFLYSFFRML
jgi:putative acetyltransferase